MSERNQKYVDYIIKSMDDICAHTGKDRHIYAEGFLAAVLADLMLVDSDNYHQFKQRVDLLKQQRSHSSKH